jgi:hypothetical protein
LGAGKTPCQIEHTARLPAADVCAAKAVLGSRSHNNAIGTLATLPKVTAARSDYPLVSTPGVGPLKDQSASPNVSACQTNVFRYIGNIGQVMHARTARTRHLPA